MELCRARCDPDVLPGRLHGCALQPPVLTDSVDVPLAAPLGSRTGSALPGEVGPSGGVVGPAEPGCVAVVEPVLPVRAGATGGDAFCCMSCRWDVWSGTWSP